MACKAFIFKVMQTKASDPVSVRDDAFFISVVFISRVLKRPSGKARGDTTSAAYSSICEHWREPRNAEWRPQAQFFNTLLDTRVYRR